MVWIEHVKGREVQPGGVESLLVDTRRSANDFGEFVSTVIYRVL
jgi:hypothetical protein